MPSSPVSPSPLVPSAVVLTSQTYGASDTWWASVVAARAAAGRACVEAAEHGVALGPRRVDRLLELLAASFPELPLLATFTDLGGELAVALGAADGRTLVVTVIGDAARATAWAADHGTARGMVRALRKALPRSTPAVGQVPMAFWRGDGRRGHAADTEERDLACPTLESILDNYAAPVREGLRWLADLEHPDATGKIVLWHGPPGTGKTHAVRAIARTWSERLGASVEVVIDPERLFASASYLHEVLLSDQRVRHRARRRPTDDAASSADEEGDEAPSPPAERLRLVLLEDAAELFSSGCRQTQGFARFLNLTDGILGQGRRVVFLLTTNEPIGRIDPGLTRPGRCVQALEFPPFDAEASTAWLAARGCGAEADPGERTLSELFALASARPLCAPAGQLGF